MQLQLPAAFPHTPHLAIEVELVAGQPAENVGLHASGSRQLGRGVTAAVHQQRRGCSGDRVCSSSPSAEEKRTRAAQCPTFPTPLSPTRTICSSALCMGCQWRERSRAQACGAGGRRRRTVAAGAGGRGPAGDSCQTVGAQHGAQPCRAHHSRRRGAGGTLCRPLWPRRSMDKCWVCVEWEWLLARTPGAALGHQIGACWAFS